MAEFPPSQARQQLDNALRQLLSPEHERELRVLMALGQEPMHASQIANELGLDHPEKTNRALRFLEREGLVERFYDREFTRRGNAFRLSQMGALAQERLPLAQDFIQSITTLSLTGPTQMTLMPVGQTAAGLPHFTISFSAREQLISEFTQLVRMFEEETERIHRGETETRKRLEALREKLHAIEQAA